VNPDENCSKDSARVKNGFGVAFITCLLCVISILAMVKALAGFMDWSWCEQLAFILIPILATCLVLYRGGLCREKPGAVRLACLAGLSLLIFAVVWIGLFFLVFLVSAFRGISRHHP
jgi:hypothetical protein